MSVETELYSVLSGDAGVTLIAASRIYPAAAPESAAMPYIVYSLVGSEKLHTLEGSGDGSRARMQMDCTAKTYSAAKSLAAAVITSLQGNGYQQMEYDLYDPTTQRHVIVVDWSFID